MWLAINPGGATTQLIGTRTTDPAEAIREEVGGADVAVVLAATPRASARSTSEPK